MTTQTENFSLYNFLLSDSYNEDNFKIPTEDDLYFDKLYASNEVVNFFYNEFLHSSKDKEIKSIVLNEFGIDYMIQNGYEKRKILNKHGIESPYQKAFYINEKAIENSNDKYDYYDNYYEVIDNSFYQTEYHTFYIKQDDEIIFDIETRQDYICLFHNFVEFKEYIETLGMIYLNPKYKKVIMDSFFNRLIENTQTIKTKKGNK